MRKLVYLLVFITSIGFIGCSDDDDNVRLPDIAVNFTATQIGLDKESNSTEVTLNLSRKSSTATDIVVNLSLTDVIYGRDFTTDPAAIDNKIAISIPAGNSSTSFKVSKVANVLFDGAESITFTIASTTNGVIIGDKKESILTFGAIVSKGQTLTLEGKANNVAYANSVYVDFSSNTQTPIDRKSWNLGFYSGSNDFRVILNGAYATTATPSTKTDITTITIDDANAALNIAASPMSDEGLSITAIDSFDGALTGTAIASISSNDADNKVYFVASEGNKTSRDQWYKVKITRKGEGYSVQYAKVNETAIKTIEVTKNSAYNFAFLSLETGKTVNVEPQAKKWDIMWSYGVGSTMGKPYFMQDLVLSNNIGGTEVTEVLTSDVTYNNFSEANLSSLKFLIARNTIGSNWRTTANMGGATGTIGVKADRFYVIKDPEGNYYKLRFLKIGLGNDGGERGRPQLEYALVK